MLTEIPVPDIEMCNSFAEGWIAVPDKWVEFLSSYLAIQGLLNSRLLSDETRAKAYKALQTLNRQVVGLPGEQLNPKEPHKEAAVHRKSQQQG